MIGCCAVGLFVGAICGGASAGLISMSAALIGLLAGATGGLMVGVVAAIRAPIAIRVTNEDLRGDVAIWAALVGLMIGAPIAIVGYWAMFGR